MPRRYPDLYLYFMFVLRVVLIRWCMIGGMRVSVCVWVCFTWEVVVCFVLRFLHELFLIYLLPQQYYVCRVEALNRHPVHLIDVVIIPLAGACTLCTTRFFCTLICTACRFSYVSMVSWSWCNTCSSLIFLSCIRYDVELLTSDQIYIDFLSL